LPGVGAVVLLVWSRNKQETQIPYGNDRQNSKNGKTSSVALL